MSKVTAIRPAFSNSTADRFYLCLSRDELEMITEAFSEYIEYYKNKNLGKGFGSTMSSLFNKIEKLG